ncbi:type II toxin-antitoxin system HigB family toxin [Crocosphaera sp. Alani8]
MFNIGGNKVRLIVAIHYKRCQVTLLNPIDVI